MVDKVVVVGLGYVGLPVAKAIAKNTDYAVVGLETNEEKIKDINLKNLGFAATSNYEEVYDANKIIICLPTPVKNRSEPDLSIVKSAVQKLATNLGSHRTDIIVESTINPGVCEKEIKPLFQKNKKVLGKDYTLTHCPERINPGDSKWNVSNIPRVLGSFDKDTASRLKIFYEEFIKAKIHVVSDVKAAEATKIVENSFRDINIAFVNELAQSFDVLGIDVKEVIDAASTKPFGFLAHYPGCGVGGHCIPVDPYYLINDAKLNGFTHDFLRMAREINEYMPEYTIQKLFLALNKLGEAVKGQEIGLLGLSYKAGVGDLRKSPALVIKNKLESLGANVITFDPYITNNELESVLTDVTCVVIATDHECIKNNKDWKNIKVIVDGKNCLNKQKIIKKGILYEGIGR